MIQSRGHRWCQCRVVWRFLRGESAETSISARFEDWRTELTRFRQACAGHGDDLVPDDEVQSVVDLGLEPGRSRQCCRQGGEDEAGDRDLRQHSDVDVEYWEITTGREGRREVK